jgi:hypothetical protein
MKDLTDELDIVSWDENPRGTQVPLISSKGTGHREQEEVYAVECANAESEPARAYCSENQEPMPNY